MPNQQRLNARDWWDIAHGRNPKNLPETAIEALQLAYGGNNGQNHHNRPKKPSTPPPEPSEAEITPPPPPPPPSAPSEPEPADHPPIPAAALAELAELAALGESVAFRRKAERLAVKLAIALIQADGGVSTLSAITADIAFALDISTQTAKRYIHKHASRWGEFVLEGDIIRLRRG